MEFSKLTSAFILQCPHSRFFVIFPSYFDPKTIDNTGQNQQEIVTCLYAQKPKQATGR